MPKRTATPPPPDDTKYLCVVSPYPANPNWDLPADRVDFARWMACALGGYEQFFAFYHKPRGRGMVIVEIDKDYQNFKGVLGEHRWVEFLKEPTPEFNERKTQVFYCLYNSDRQAQKDGWLRIDVDETWFDKKKWSLRNQKIKYPYPATHWCAPPPASQTHKDLCRPLPVQVHPPPPSAVPRPGHADQAGGPKSGRSAAPQMQRGTSGSVPVQKLSQKNVPWNNTKLDLNTADALPKAKSPTAPSPIEGTIMKLTASDLHDSDDDGDDDDLPLATEVSMELPESIRVTLVKTAPRQEEILCPIHGRACSKGICQEMSNFKREQALAKKKAEREEEKKKWEENRASKKRGKKAKDAVHGTASGDLGSIQTSENESPEQSTHIPSVQDEDELILPKGSVKVDNPWDIAEDPEF